MICRFDFLLLRLISDDVGRLLRKFGRAREKFPSCATGSTGTIPEDHLYNQKKKPLIIGHRGNPKVYQENTMDGFESLIKKKFVDGFELDVFLTKDKKLAVFHDADLEVNSDLFHILLYSQNVDHFCTI